MLIKAQFQRSSAHRVGYVGMFRVLPTPPGWFEYDIDTIALCLTDIQLHGRSEERLSIRSEWLAEYRHQLYKNAYFRLR